MWHDVLEEQESSWKLVLLGFLAVAFGIAAVVLPVTVLTFRVIDLIFGLAKPFSASMTAVAALFALVAVVAVDSLASLLGTGVTGKHASRIRGAVGVVVVIAAIFWPDRTVVAALWLVGLWAILIGVLELLFAICTSKVAKDRAWLIIAAIASIAIGVGVITKMLFGVVLVSALVGIAAAVRGISLILTGISRRLRHEGGSKKQAASAASDC